MSFVAAAIGTALVGAAVYTSDKQRKAMHQQQDALKASQDADQREAAEADTNAAVSANTQLAAVKKRRRDSALALGDPSNTGGTLGGASVLGAGSATQTVASKPATSALGSAVR